MPIIIPAGVTVTVNADNVVTVKGKKGELTQAVNPAIKVNVSEKEVTFEIDEQADIDVKQKQAFHGLYRSLVNNMVVGVSEGYKKQLESERNQNPQIILESCDKQLLGQVCAKIRSFRKPEPYKGKGVLFIGEQIRRKSGKSAGAK